MKGQFPNSIKEDPEIVEYISKAKEVLRDFYQSEWFQKISFSEEFQTARSKATKVKEEGLNRIRKKKERKNLKKKLF